MTPSPPAPKHRRGQPGDKPPRGLQWLVRLLPLETREAHGSDMEQVLHDSLLETSPNRAARLRFWIAATVDILRVAPRQHAEALARDIRYAVRSFRRSPAFSTAAIVTMALGIGTTAAVFAFVDGVLLRPLPYEDPSRVMLLWATMPDGTRTWLAAPEVDDLRERVPALSGVAGLTDIKFGLTGVGAPEEVQVVGASASFFPLLGVDMQLGRAFTAQDDVENAARTVILSDGLWRRRFGARADVINASILMDGRSYTVIGVTPRTFSMLPPSSVFPARVDAWVSLQPHLITRTRDVRYLHAIGRLSPDSSESELRSQLASAGAHLSSAFPEYRSRRIAFDAVRMDQDVVREIRPALLVLFATVALVLVIASANVAALLLARSMSRRREIAVRAALGASQARIARQLLTEGIVLGLAGGLGGLAIAWLAPALSRIPPLSTMPRFDQVAMGWRVALFAFGIAAVTGVLVMLAPLAELRRRSGTLGPEVLRLTGRSHSAIRAGRALVVFQIAITASVLVVALMLARGFAGLLGGDPGFNPTGVLTMRVALPPKYRAAPDITRFYDTALDRITAISGVHAAAAIAQLPLSGSVLGSRFTLDTRTPDAGVDADLRGITPRYFETMGIRLVEGRAFTPSDGVNTPAVAVVDETFARRAWPQESAVGKRIRWIRQSDRPIEVVGVVAGIRHKGLEAPPRETVYRPHAQYARNTMVFVVRGAGDAARLAHPVLAAIREVDADQPVADVTTMDALMQRSLAQPGFATGLAATLAAMALMLTVVGTYGLSSYAVAQRQREIGIRLALGARPGGVIRMILGEGVRSAAMGLALGLPLAIVAARTVSAKLTGAAPADPLLVIIVAIALVITIAAACWIPARRASRVSPSEPLRSE